MDKLYDNLNRLTDVNSYGGVCASYSYDVYGRCMSKAAKGETVSRIWDGDSMWCKKWANLASAMAH